MTWHGCSACDGSAIYNAPAERFSVKSSVCFDSKARNMTDFEILLNTPSYVKRQLRMNTIDQFRALLNSKKHPNTDDLIQRILPHLHELECQANVIDGTPVNDKNGKPTVMRTNGKQTWWPLRTPKHNASEPRFDLCEYYAAFGSSGYLYESKKSLYVAFDFDSIAGHAAGVGISNVQLAEIEERVSQVPWVEVRQSTSGGTGLHLYVWINLDTCPKIEDRSDHASVARLVLDRLSKEVEFAFKDAADKIGEIIWVLARRATNPNSFKLIKQNTELYPYSLTDFKLYAKATKSTNHPAHAGTFDAVELDDEHKAQSTYTNCSRQLEFRTSMLTDTHQGT